MHSFITSTLGDPFVGHGFLNILWLFLSNWTVGMLYYNYACVIISRMVSYAVFEPILFSLQSREIQYTTLSSSGVLGCASTSTYQSKTPLHELYTLCPL